jgi:hypothetical protein
MVNPARKPPPLPKLPKGWQQFLCNKVKRREAGRTVEQRRRPTCCGRLSLRANVAKRRSASLSGSRVLTWGTTAGEAVAVVRIAIVLLVAIVALALMGALVDPEPEVLLP